MLWIYLRKKYFLIDLSKWCKQLRFSAVYTENFSCTQQLVATPSWIENWQLPIIYRGIDDEDDDSRRWGYQFNAWNRIIRFRLRLWNFTCCRIFNLHFIKWMRSESTWIKSNSLLTFETSKNGILNRTNERTMSVVDTWFAAEFFSQQNKCGDAILCDFLLHNLQLTATK